MTERPLETGWLPDTPVADNLLRRFLRNQADLDLAVAEAAGGRVEDDGDVACADAGNPVPFLNQAVAFRPVDDALVERVERFFAGSSSVATLLSAYPTPDLAPRGWHLVGHPAFVVRAPGPVDRRPPDGVELRPVDDLRSLGEFEQVLAEGYPAEEARGRPPGSVFPLGALARGVTLRTGLLDGVPVAAGAGFVGSGVVNLCSAATLPAARRRGVWESLVWARVADGPDLPAVAYTSDFSRPGFERMGFMPILRLTLWLRPPG